MRKHDLVIIGAGSAGLAAYKGAKDKGLKDVLLIERNDEYGGILQQCVHNGFGLHTFNEELSGPSYAEKYYESIEDEHICILYNTTVLAIDNKVLTISNQDGIEKIEAKAIILASGSKEKPAGAIGLKGDRVTGVYTAGAAQKYCNRLGYLVGKKVFILGSGDIGLIMARRMSLEGAKVIGVAEIMPYSNGLARNIKQCLEDFDIPLYLSHTVESIHGKDRLEYINLVEVDKNLKPIKGSDRKIECDCLLLSIGLIPDVSLIERIGAKIDPKSKSAIVDETYMTSLDGIFACGNCLHIHDLVDYVSLEAYKAGQCACDYITNGKNQSPLIKNNLLSGISYMVPQYFHKGKDVEFSFRVNKVFKECAIHVFGSGIDLKFKKLGIVPSEMQKVKLSAKQLSPLQEELNWEVLL